MRRLVDTNNVFIQYSRILKSDIRVMTQQRRDWVFQILSTRYDVCAEQWQVIMTHEVGYHD